MSNSLIFLESKANPNNCAVNLSLCTYIQKVTMYRTLAIKFGGIGDGERDFYWIYDTEEDRERDYYECLNARR